MCDCDKCGKFKKVLHVLAENVVDSKSLCQLGWWHVVISYGCYVNVSHAWPSGLVHTCRFYLASLPLCMSHDHQPIHAIGHRPLICSLMTDQSCIMASFFVPLL